ncbi:MAG: glycosyltransferase family 4 protein [Planctomycetota bacterium]|nr:glycosyltransferase family 4 protein [Planctomycetota bacterium]
MRHRGLELDLFPIPARASRRLRLFKSLRSYALVGIQRKLFGAAYFYLLRRLVRRLVYDFDDALYIRDSRDWSGRSWTRRGRFERTVRSADLVIAGNRLLVAEARRYNRRVRLLPTSIDTNRYRPLPRRSRSGSAVTIGWIGSRSTLFYLEDIAATLDLVPAPGLPPVRLKVIADEFVRLRRMEVIRKTWREEEEVDDLRGVDIGIMPLRDDLWSRGKCGLKLLQYMAMGIPVICSPVGTNLDLVTDGVEGLHAAGAEGWVQAVRRLAADPVLRKRMGQRGREKVERNYSATGAAEHLAEILRSVGVS